jgi:hypothetical protein
MPIPKDRLTVGALMGLVGFLSFLLLLVEANHRESAEVSHRRNAEQLRLLLQRSRDIEAMDAEVRAREGMTYAEPAFRDPTWNRRMIPRFQAALDRRNRPAERGQLLTAPGASVSP